MSVGETHIKFKNIFLQEVVMANYILNKTVQSCAPITPNVIECEEMFGIGADSEQTIRIVDDLKLRIEPGDVVYVTGGSGAGKSTVLSLLREQMADAIDLQDVVFPAELPAIDCFGGGLSESMRWLSLSGLSDAFAMLRQPEHLSDGQRYRLRLALAMAKKPDVIFIDEYCNHLDRVAAAMTSVGVRKFADHYGTTFVVATAHDDILEDLAPDVVVIIEAGARCQVFYPRRMRFED
jgi:uncharacterized protein